VTQRRWLAFCNPPLRNLLTKTLGSDAWITDLDQLVVGSPASCGRACCNIHALPALYACPASFVRLCIVQHSGSICSVGSWSPCGAEWLQPLCALVCMCVIGEPCDVLCRPCSCCVTARTTPSSRRSGVQSRQQPRRRQQQRSSRSRASRSTPTPCLMCRWVEACRRDCVVLACAYPILKCRQQLHLNPVDKELL